MKFFERLFGTSASYRSESGSDTILTAEPVDSRRRELLWQDVGGLEFLMMALQTPGRSGSSVHIGSAETSLAGLSQQDLEWALRVVRTASDGEALAQQGRYKDAVKKFRAALEMAPGSDILLMNLGVIYGMMGQPREGLPYLERAREIAPANERIAANLDRLRSML